MWGLGDLVTLFCVHEFFDLLRFLLIFLQPSLHEICERQGTGGVLFYKANAGRNP